MGRIKPMPRMKPKLPTRLTGKGFMFANIAVGRKPETNQQIRNQADSPSQKQLQEVVGHTSINIENVNSEM